MGRGPYDCSPCLLTNWQRAAPHKETQIDLTVDLDGTGQNDISTGLPFFDHMLAQLAKHARFDLQLRTVGDLEIDAHHTVEDTGIALGEAMRKAWGDKAGVRRFSSYTVPLDEAAVEVVLDLSGRPFLHYESIRGREDPGRSALRPSAV